MIFARRDKLPERIRVNKAGGLSVLSFVRHFEIGDRPIFHVRVINEPERKQLILTAVEHIPDELQNDEPVRDPTPEEEFDALIAQSPSEEEIDDLPF